MAKQVEDNLTQELPIHPPKRGRGRPSTGKARSSAERMRELRARQRAAVWGSDCEERIPVTVTGLLEQLRYAVREGYSAIARDLARQLVDRAEQNDKLRHSDEKKTA